MFKEPFTEEDERVLEEIIKPMKAEAEAASWSHCLEGEAVFWHEYHRALAPGHIYSEAGRTEFTRISHLCEYHFDSVTDPSVVESAVEAYFDGNEMR